MRAIRANAPTRHTRHHAPWRATTRHTRQRAIRATTRHYAPWRAMTRHTRHDAPYAPWRAIRAMTRHTRHDAPYFNKQETATLEKKAKRSEVLRVNLANLPYQLEIYVYLWLVASCYHMVRTLQYHKKYFFAQSYLVWHQFLCITVLFFLRQLQLTIQLEMIKKGEQEVWLEINGFNLIYYLLNYRIVFAFRIVLLF